jgi:ketosteroid isomerase-like protein
MIMTEKEALTIFIDLQKAFERKDIDSVLKYYHPEITYIGPAFQAPLSGLNSLQKALIEHFKSPRRMRVEIRNLRVRNLSSGVHIVSCLMEGTQSIYLSEQYFKINLSRVFIEVDGQHLIIHEHISFAK